MSELNGYRGPGAYSRFTEAEWRELHRCAAGEIEPGAVASLLKRVVGNFDYLDTDQLRRRCYELCELHEFWGV